MTGRHAEILGAQYGLTADEVRRALKWAQTAKLAASRPRKQERRARWDFARFPEPQDGRTWCQQCEQRVTSEQALQCLSAFCKAREDADSLSPRRDQPQAQGV